MRFNYFKFIAKFKIIKNLKLKKKENDFHKIWWISDFYLFWLILTGLIVFTVDSNKKKMTINGQTVRSGLVLKTARIIDGVFLCII